MRDTLFLIIIIMMYIRSLLYWLWYILYSWNGEVQRPKGGWIDDIVHRTDIGYILSDRMTTFSEICLWHTGTLTSHAEDNKLITLTLTSTAVLPFLLI